MQVLKMTGNSISSSFFSFKWVNVSEGKSSCHAYQEVNNLQEKAVMAFWDIWGLGQAWLEVN